MNKIDKFLIGLQKIPARDKIFLLQNLGIIIKSGMPLTAGLKTLALQTKNKKLKGILITTEASIKQGKTFGESLEQYKKDFGEMFINMIKAGEISGQLEEVLEELYVQTKKDNELRSKIKGAMIYPTVILVAMVGIGIFVIIFVLPNVTSMFDQLDTELPLTTRLLIWVSNFAKKNGIFIGAGFIALIALLARILKTKGGKKAFDRILLRLPIFGPIIKKINIARTTRNLSSLIKTDINIVQTIQITANILGNTMYKEALMRAAQDVKKGKKLGEIFGIYPKLFPPVIIQMITIGEESGSLDDILEKVAEFYEEEIFQTMESLPTLIEPVLMIIMGIAVGGIAMAIMMPMYSLTQTF
jgi:type IV pilus assembly protein PilC